MHAKHHDRPPFSVECDEKCVLPNFRFFSCRRIAIAVDLRTQSDPFRYRIIFHRRHHHLLLRCRRRLLLHFRAHHQIRWIRFQSLFQSPFSPDHPDEWKTQRRHADNGPRYRRGIRWVDSFFPFLLPEGEQDAQPLDRRKNVACISAADSEGPEYPSMGIHPVGCSPEPVPPGTVIYPRLPDFERF